MATTDSQQATQTSAASEGSITGNDTFSAGATLTSQLNFISDGMNFYYWTGAFDKVVPAGSTPDDTGGVGDGAWKVAGDAAIRADLKAPEGAKLSGYRYSDVYSRLSALLTQSDIGAPRPYLGYNPTTDATIATIGNASSDVDYMGIGSISLGKKLTGIRRNGVILSLRGNQVGAGFFNTQIDGVSNSMGLRGYSSSGTDGVTFYCDISSLPYATWENVASATYTSTSVTPSDPNAYTNAKIGDVIYTKHDTVCAGIITAKNANGSLSVDMWADSGTTTTTPTNGVGFYLNSQNKLWGQNTNLLLPAEGRATKGVIQENGVRNNKTDNSNEINGIDNVVLGGLYDCTAAFLARGSSGKGWLIGFMSQGAKNANFHSYSGIYKPRAGFYEQSAAEVGIRLRTNNTVASIEWANSSDIADHSEANVYARIDSAGRVRKQSLALTVISASATLSSFAPALIVSASEIILTLPSKTIITTGHRIKIYAYVAGNIYLKGNDGTVVEGWSTYTLVAALKGIYEVIYDGNSWLVFGVRGT